MQKEIQINTKDDHIIYGTLDSKQNSDTLLIFVHGLSGHKDEHHYFNAVPYFTEKNFDTFRFNFYTREPHSRLLSESSLTTHSDDLKLVINNFKEKYKNIILIGHSFGALIIINTDLSDISKIVLWDPTGELNKIKEKNASFNSDLNKYILHWGMDILINKELADDWQSVDLSKSMKNLKTPCKFIFAGNSSKHKAWEPFLKKIKVKNESVIINGATHGFIEEGVEQKLFEETFDWVKN